MKWISRSDEASSSQAPGVGDPAATLQLDNAEGEAFDLASARGHPVLLSFLSHAA